MNQDKLIILNSKLTVLNSKLNYVKLIGNYTFQSVMRINVDSLKKEKENIEKEIKDIKNGEA